MPPPSRDLGANGRVILSSNSYTYTETCSSDEEARFLQTAPHTKLDESTRETIAMSSSEEESRRKQPKRSAKNPPEEIASKASTPHLATKPLWSTPTPAPHGPVFQRTATLAELEDFTNVILDTRFRQQAISYLTANVQK
nr:unnamed protein product [Spirometra erinaceieuropaei]